MWRAFWANPVSKLFSIVFFSILERKFLVSLQRKHSSSTFYFFFSPPKQTHSKKVFLPIFFSKFSIHLILPPNKHTLRLSSLSNSRDTTYTTTFVITCTRVASCEWWSKSGGLTTCHMSKLWQKLWWKLCPEHYF